MFERIISDANFEAAYLKIIDQFAADRKNSQYHGLDNLLLRDYDFNSKDLIAQAKHELIAKKPIEPALAIKIPKKSNPEKVREIFIYNLKERIKAQAIAQIVLPEFEQRFSDRLFSYRPGKPPYLAAKHFCRRYRREFKVDQALILDLENYSELIDKNILCAQLAEIFPEPEVMAVLRLFIFNQVYRDGKINVPTKGLVQGVPLIALFANLYLSDLDFKYQKSAPFYIRVGDDIAFLDKNLVKLEKLKLELIDDLVARGLKINHHKLFIGPAQLKFSFLGYQFCQGLISLESNFIRKTELAWKKILVYKNLAIEQKVKLLQRIMKKPESNFNRQFIKIISDKSQINDSKQIQLLSESFFRIMTRFIFLHYSPRRRRLLNNYLQDINLRSLYNFFMEFHYERHQKSN